MRGVGHAGNQGRAKRLCHMGKRWERQIGTKRQPDLRELLSEVDVRGFCMWSPPAAWGYSQLLLLLHPDSDQSRSWVAAAEQCLCLQSNEKIPEENISCLISIQPGGHCPRTASPSCMGGCQLPFSPTNTILNKLALSRTTVLQQPWPPQCPGSDTLQREGVVGQEWLHHEEVV